MVLYDYQESGVKSIREAFRRGSRSVLFVLPTGGGKTIMFNHIASISKVRCLILVHRVELMEQALKKSFVDAEALTSKNLNPKARVCVGMVQTVSNNIGRTPHFDLIIVDEAHHANATTYKKILSHFNTRVIGFTATPVRSDGSGLWETFDEMVVGASVSLLMERGFLMNPKCFAPSSIKTEDIRVVSGDFSRGDSVRVINKPSINGDVIESYKKLTPNAVAIAFCISVQHAIDVRDSFRSAGISSEAIYGDMSEKDRNLVSNGLGVDYKVLCSCDVVSEGYDVPAAEAALLIRPTQSLGLYKQQVGRVMRTMKGKNNAFVLDFVGNIQRHGMPSDDVEWSLNVQKRKGRVEKIDSIHQCANCFSVYEKSRVCPDCGVERESTPREIKKVEAELKEIKRVEKRKEQGRAETLEDLLRIAKDRGYKKGWAYAVFNSRKRKGNS